MIFSGSQQQSWQSLPMPPMWKRIQRTSDFETPPKNSQRWIPGAMQRLPKSISDQVATEAASNGPRRGETLSLSGVLLHLQDQTAAQWASAQAFGKLMMTKLVNYFRLALPSVQSTVSQCQARAKQRGVLRLSGLAIFRLSIWREAADYWGVWHPPSTLLSTSQMTSSEDRSKMIG